MANKIPFCCPEPAIKNALHPHPVSKPTHSVTSADTATTRLCSPEGDPLIVQMDASTVPPRIIGAMNLDGTKYEGDLTALVDCEATLTGTACNGAPLEATGKVGELVQVVQAPGQVLSVRFCDDAASRDWELVKRCDPETGVEILFQWDVKTNPPTLISATDLSTGEPFTGDANELVNCGGGTTLAAQAQKFCDAGQEFLRWFVTENGEPTGTVYDTMYDGSPYTVTDEAGVVEGDCEISCVKTPLGVVTSWAI